MNLSKDLGFWPDLVTYGEENNIQWLKYHNQVFSSCKSKMAAGRGPQNFKASYILFQKGYGHNFGVYL